MNSQNEVVRIYSKGGFGASFCPVTRRKPGGRLVLKVTSFVGSAKFHAVEDDIRVFGVLDTAWQKCFKNDNFCQICKSSFHPLRHTWDRLRYLGFKGLVYR